MSKSAPEKYSPQEQKELHLPAVEERTLRFWKEHNVFEKSLEKCQVSGVRCQEFVFYEGPPTANGRPGIHHVLARAFKDVVLRYKTMRRFFVPRKGGWDTHGLPVELEVEKELGFKSKKDIETFGIAAFNKKCKESVWKYKDEWERLTERMGYWLDLKNPYITYENNYIETLWWIIKEVWKKKLLYKGHRVAPWCPRCGTALSSHEMAQGYKTLTDDSVYVRFKLKPGQKITNNFTTNNKTFILSWTTTPWTLPGNVALAVGKSIEYVRIARDDAKESIILAKAIFAGRPEAFPGYRAMGDVRGAELVGLAYEPLFNIKSLRNKNSHKIYAADFVTTTDGTGVVHTAVMYGEDDYKLGVDNGLPQHHTVDEQGRFTKEVPGLVGLKAKSKDAGETAKTEQKIFDHLAKKNLLFKTEKYTHEYPHCWRCQTPLLYYARTSWFVAMSKLRAKLLASNKTINWVPAHMKDGRFGEWLKDVKDWNFSRERYWGTPLPIWECKQCGAQEVIGSAEELHARSGGVRNEYWVMRHGQAESNMLHLVDSGQGKYHLTPKGEKEVDRTAAQMKKEGIQMIFASGITRTKETALRMTKALGVKKIVSDKRLREIHLGTFAGCHDTKYHKAFPTYQSRFEEAPEKGETLRDLRARMWEFLKETEKKYKGKKILLVSHEYPIWMLDHVARGMSEAETINEKETRGNDYVKTASIFRLDLRTVPRDETGLADFHRPYIDELTFPCVKCKKGKMTRVKELADVWFDSGAMPFAQIHYPFDGNKSLVNSHKSLATGYPADYITEAVDQTRGWFYTLLAVATLLGKEAPYKNVISLGHILDKQGQKMSKSKGNVVDPWAMAEKYGMDAVRWHFYTAVPAGEPMNFDELELQKTTRRFHLILWNSFIFWKTYATKKDSRFTIHDSRNVLDKWILARLHETTVNVTKHIDAYAIRDAALAIEKLVDDLSRWYIRRSRRRLQKPESKTDFNSASATLGYVLAEIAKLIAPFNPFFAEALYEGIANRVSGLGKESIHLEDWPLDSARGKSAKLLPTTYSLLASMAEVRRIASAALAKRASLGIKIRQPLATLKIQITKSKLQTNNESQISNELIEILKDEVNVKKVVIDPKLKEEIEFDITITPELKEEGVVREFVRMVAELRAKAGLEPKDAIALFVEAPEMFRGILSRNEKLLKKEVGAKLVEYKKSAKFNAEISTKLEDSDIWLAVRKVK